MVSLDLAPGNLPLRVGETGTLTGRVTGSSDQGITCSSSNSNIATVSGGSDGTCTVRAIAVGIASVLAVARADTSARDASSVQVTAGPGV
jgi:uncharacterized protein YjdB